MFFSLFIVLVGLSVQGQAKSDIVKKWGTPFKTTSLLASAPYKTATIDKKGAIGNFLPR
jgi:hypothetical protein